MPETAVELLARFKWEAAKGATWDAADPAWKEPWLNVARKQAYELAPLFLSALLSDEVVEAHARKPSELAGSDRGYWDQLDDEEKEILLAESRAMLQAVIDHLGSKDRG